MTQYGPELVLNGDFADDSGWTQGFDWLEVSGGIAAGVANFERDNIIGAGDFDLSRTLPLTAGKSYKVNFTITAKTGNAAIVPILGSTAGTSRSTANTFSETIIAGSGTTIIFRGSGDFGDTASIDNVSIQEILTAGPIIEQIAEFIYLALVLVTEDYGFNQDLIPLRPKRIFFTDEITADLTVLIAQEQPARLEMTHSTIDWQQPFVLAAICFDSDAATASIDTRLNTIRSDIEKKLTEDITLGGLAYDLQIEPPDIFTGERFSGIAVNCNVFYRTQLTDPYTLA